MHFLNIRELLDEMLDDELGLVGYPRTFEFLHHSHTDVYRIRAGGRRFIAHAASGSKAYLRQVHDNLDRLADLDDVRIPRIAAWRSSNGGVLPGFEWAVLVYEEFQGRVLSGATFSAAVWHSLADLLERVHELDGDAYPSAGPVFSHGHPSAFSAFAEAFLVRIADLPVRVERVAPLLEQLDAYANQHLGSFAIPPRLVHGDLDRCNFIVGSAGIGLLNWGAMRPGDYGFDLAMLRYVLDSVAPHLAHRLVTQLAERYRSRFQDDALETRLHYYTPLAGLVKAYEIAGDTREDPESRARQVWTRYLYSDSRWRAPVRLDDKALPRMPRRVA